MRKTLSYLLLCSALPLVNAQWSKSVPNTNITNKSDNSVYYKLDIDALRGKLLSANIAGKKGVGNTIVSLPMNDGKMERFSVESFPVVDEALATKYQLGSYVGVGVDDPTKYVRFSVAPNDFQSMVISNGKYEFIEPATRDKGLYSVHAKSKKEGNFLCSTLESAESAEQLNSLLKKGSEQKSGNKKFHTLRLALSVTGEYTNAFGGVAGALAQINATLTRVNGVFEQEFNLHLNMVSAESLIFTNASSDPYSDSSYMCKWNYELMNVLHGGQYGVTDADFDIGHLFGASGGGGNAGCIGCIGSNDVSYEVISSSSIYACTTPDEVAYGYNSPNDYKGSGITSPGIGLPSGDAFDIDYVAHELGHQLGANHTFSYNEDTGVNVEPGSGSTIMGYAGITGSNTDVQANSDPYFNSASIDQVQNNLTAKGVGVVRDITNNPPVVTAMTTTYTIPKSTAFVLTASATDSDGDVLTYCWEQMTTSKLANGIGKAAGTGDKASAIGATTSGANFRSYLPTTNPTRYFPKLSTVLGGVVKNVNDFEAASTVARTTDFRVTVRDNKPAGEAQTAYQTQRIVIGSASAFTVSTTSLIPNSTSAISWVVSGTDVSPYNAANVKIDFTYDNGVTWVTLAESVPNSGSASVFIPSELAGKTGSIRVSAIGNVFYAVKKATVGSLGLSDVNKKEIAIYPNPVKNILNVSNLTGKVNYEIINVAGQSVSRGLLTEGKINVNQLTKGVYFVNLEVNGEIVKTKFIKE